MSYKKVLYFLIASVIGFSDSAFVDTLNKCEIHDNDCLKSMIQNFIKDISKTGAPELGISPFDPYELKNLKFSILDALNMTIHEGTAKGIRKCVVNNFEAIIEKRQAYLDITCDLFIKCKYNMVSHSEGIKVVFGGDVHGDGNAKIKIDELNLKIYFPAEVQKRGDDTYLSGDLKKYKYILDIRGKVTIDADNLYVGEKESSKEISKLFNENWESMVTPIKKVFGDVAISVIYDNLYKFFNNTPTNKFIIDDLTPYIRKIK